MKKEESSPAEAAERAEEHLSSKTAVENLPRTVADMRRLLHELQRHRAELETQNEEMRRTWQGLELSPNKYDKLYVHSPVGYFTFDVHGLIREVNLAGAKLLGMERQLLVNKSFFAFIPDGDEREIFSSHLESVLQREGMRRCEIRLARNDGTVTYWQLQSVAVATIKNEDVYILTSIVDGTFGNHFGEELQSAHDRLEATESERNAELTKAMLFLADLYHALGDPHPAQRQASVKSGPTGGFDTLDGASTGLDVKPAESARSPKTAWRKNFSFLTITKAKIAGLCGLFAIAAIAAVSYLSLQPKGKTTGARQEKTRNNMVGYFQPRTSTGKMNRKKNLSANLSAVIRFNVSPHGVIYVNGEKKGVAPTLRELKVKEGRYTIAIKYKNFKTYRRVVNLAPQERIVVEHSFRKRTATGTTKYMTGSKSANKEEKAAWTRNPAVFAATTAKGKTNGGNPIGRGGKPVQKINPSAFSATFTPQ